ncbi:hypothetical protein Bbelb_059190 [Branchiostoma belcheri]|nr:hypothetical protein Bbelb_059190 [Branchiostoma belcheri]
MNLIESRQISGNSTIQHDLDELNNWSTVHRMQLHPKKCKVMYLHFSRTVPPLPPLKIDDHPLQEVKVAKLLGLHLQADLRWDVHVEHMVKKGGTRLFLLRKLKTFRLSIEDLLTIYTSYVRPVCEYAVPAWHPGLTQAQRNQLERIQRRAVRTILGKNYTNYADACLLLGLVTLERRRDHLCLTFAKKLLQSPDYRHWFPPRRGDISGRTTRSSNQIDCFRTRTERFRNSALPYMIVCGLDLGVRFSYPMNGIETKYTGVFMDGIFALLCIFLIVGVAVDDFVTVPPNTIATPDAELFDFGLNMAIVITIAVVWVVFLVVACINVSIYCILVVYSHIQNLRERDQVDDQPGGPPPAYEPVAQGYSLEAVKVETEPRVNRKDTPATSSTLITSA